MSWRRWMRNYMTMASPDRKFNILVNLYLVYWEELFLRTVHKKILFSEQRRFLTLFFQVIKEKNFPNFSFHERIFKNFPNAIKEVKLLLNLCVFSALIFSFWFIEHQIFLLGRSPFLPLRTDPTLIYMKRRSFSPPSSKYRTRVNQVKCNCECRRVRVLEDSSPTTIRNFNNFSIMASW